MRCRWLGWAGVELEYEGERLVIDPLREPRAVFAPLGERANAATMPQLVAGKGDAVAGLVTHLHRDHADAGALVATLVEGAPVLTPPIELHEGLGDIALVQAACELDASALALRGASAWESFELGPSR